MAKKSGLGRGLSAIFEEVEDAYEKEVTKDRSSVKEIPIELIEVNPFQPRKTFDEEALEELGQSIQKHGLIQPVLVIETKHGFMLIAGERRLRATKLIGLERIKAVVAELPESSFREIALIENIQRENLNALELAQSYKELISDYGITHEELAETVHKSRAHITNTLRLLQLGEYAREKITTGDITHGHSKILVGLEDKQQKKIVDSIINQNLNVRQTESLVRALKEEPKSDDKKSTKRSKGLDFSPLSKKMAESGLKIKTSGNKLVINFESQEDIDRLFNIIK